MSTKGFKVRTPSCPTRKGIAAQNLQDLIQKSTKKFNLYGELQLFEEDGTLVDDDEYFNTLPERTSLIVVPKKQFGSEKRLEQLAQRILQDNAAFISFTDEELEVVGVADPNILAQLIRKDLEQVLAYQEACRHELSRHQTIKEAKLLLEAYHNKTK